MQTEKLTSWTADFRDSARAQQQAHPDPGLCRPHRCGEPRPRTGSGAGHHRRSIRSRGSSSLCSSFHGTSPRKNIFDLREVICRTINLYSPIIKKRGITIMREDPLEPLNIKGRP